MVPSATAGPPESTQGIRATRPHLIWHVDTTVVRLLDGTRAYLHAVIDNFSRKILSWRLSERFEIGNSVAVLVEAGRALNGDAPPTLLADSGMLPLDLFTSTRVVEGHFLLQSCLELLAST